MTATEHLFLRWQFEFFTKEAQDQYVNQMVEEFAKAWKWKKNRSFIQQRVKDLSALRPDLFIEDEMYLSVGSSLYSDWSTYDERKKKKIPEVYIGPETWMCM